MKNLTIVITLSHDIEGLKKTLDSLKNQKYKNFDIVVLENIYLKDKYLKDDIISLYDNIQFIPCLSKTYGMQMNEVIKNLTTPYVMFMEDYDVLDKKFIYYNMRALEKHAEVDLAVGKAFCISPLLTKMHVEHKFSKRYIKNYQIINVMDTPECIVTNWIGCILRTKSIQNIKIQETINLEIGADLILKLLLNNPNYVSVPKAEYDYFEPIECQTPYHVQAHNPEWYEKSIRNFLLPLLDYSEKIYENIPVFIQYYVMYNINCRMMENKDNRNKKVVLGDDLTSYIKTLKELFSRIDDYYLLNQDDIKYITKNPELRCMYLRIKYENQEIPYSYEEIIDENGEIDLEMRFKDYVISNLNKHRFLINVMNYVDGKVWIDGSLISIFNYGNVEYIAKFNDTVYTIKDTDAYSFTKYFGIPGYKRVTYHLELPLDHTKNIQRITFFAKINGKEYQMKISFGNHWAKLSKSPRYSYWHFNNYLCHHADNGIVFKKATFKNLLIREIQFQLNLIKNHHSKDLKALGFRWIYWITYPHYHKQKIWLMLDKLYKGGDSCEYLYRYSANKDDGITKYYLINEGVSDYNKLVEDGFKPLVPGTLKHKLVFVHADIVLITNSHLFPFNGYNKSTSKYIRGLCNFGSMCLQHGLSVQKCAMAQRRIIDNTMMYFLASKYEYKNLTHHAYGYDGFDILKLTGIARYDGLVNNDQKQILISPTWRMYNALPVTTSEGEQRGYNPEFKHTTYFKIYNNLINNERLLKGAKKYGYKIKFLLHPIISSQLEDFTKNSELEVIPSVGDLSYEEILTKSSLMVTDYSGVQFDFAYMRKPIVYFHPEELPPHYEDGIFFYDTMGFGEICKKTEELIDMLIEYMSNNCQMKEMYRNRADDFFYYNDHKNCERIYNEILKYQKQVDIDKLR